MASSEPLPAKVDLILYRGDTRIWTDVIRQNIGTTAEPNLVPYDLTGHTFLAQIRGDKNRTEPVVATIAVEVVGDPTAGTIKLTLTSAEADKLPGEEKDQRQRQSLFWDLQITRTADGFRRTHLAGTVTVKGDVSNG